MYKSSWPYYTNEMIDNVTNVLKSGKVNQWTGTKVIEFEKCFSDYFDVKHSIAVFNGTIALELCLKTLDIGYADQVIVTSRSFIASASAINICNAEPVFADVDESSQGITLNEIQKLVNNKTKAVIVVHLAGYPCDIEEIVTWCHENNIYVIEDCAQAHGAKYNNKYVGSFGDINAWSFCQDKIMSTGGEGGMVTTNNSNYFKKAWSYKDHGKNYDKIYGNHTTTPGMFRWIHDSIGTNWRMTEFQASIGIDSLKMLDQWVNQRRVNASILDNVFKCIPFIIIPHVKSNVYHAYYKYYCFVDENKLIDNVTRNDIILKLNSLGIPCFQGTCGEIYKEKAYQLDVITPISKRLSEMSLMFLVDPSYSVECMKEVGDLIKDTLLQYVK